LASVVGEICRRAGLKTFDTSGLYGVVRGFAIEQVTDARAALQPLMIRHGFDAIERDGVLQFRMRDGLEGTALAHAQLAVTSELDGVLEQVREAEAEISGRVRLRFVQADGNFDTIAEEAVLADETTHAVSTSELNMVLTRAEGRQIAERWLTEARVSRENLRLALPPSQLCLGAGDVIELPGEGQEGPGLYRIDRVEQAELQVIDAVRIEPEVYDPAEIDDELAQLRSFVPPVPVVPYFMDLPLIRGDEVPHAPHIAATGKPWPGTVAVFQSGTDADYTLNTTLPRPAVIGSTRSVMHGTCAGLIDRGPALEVKLISGTLSSVSEEALLSGTNIAAIGDGTAGNWEVFQFAEAELVGPRTYHLRTRLRGQAGSDGAMPPVWPEGSVFVLLNGSAVQITQSPNLRGVAQHYRIGPARRGYDDPSYRHIEEAFEGNGLRPYRPCHLKAAETSGGDLDVSWIRRTRVDGDPWEGAEVPLGEESESYVVKVSKDGVLLRETHVAAPAWYYGAGEQNADGAVAPFTVSVAQVSAAYGAGPAQTLWVNS
jgi:hypothetical protein